MSSLSIEIVNTKLEAYKLVHDPTRLLCLLYSKYGDIEEDYYLSYINQIYYNVPSHYNCIYKENQFLDNIEEFLKRLYKKYESKERVPKLSEYYKNYLKFFCRPMFKNYKLGKLLHDYEDKKAEIFYKNNYADSIKEIEDREKEKEISYKKSSSSLSSLDNITDNKIIFNKRTKNIIDNDLNNELCTITLTLESSWRNLIKENNSNNNIYKGCLISKRSNGNSSFEKNIYSLVHYQLNKKLKKKNKIMENSKKSKSQRKKKFLNSPSSHAPYIAKIYKKNNMHNHNGINKDFNQKNKNTKNSLYTLSRKKYIKNNCFISYKNDKGFLSPKITKHLMNFTNGISSKLEEFNKNRPNNYKFYMHNSSKKNKTYNNTNNTNTTNTKTSKTKNSNIKNMNYTNNTTSIYKNFSNLSESLNKFKNINFKNSNITYTNKNNSGNSNKKIIKSTNTLIKPNINENKKMKKKLNNNINKTTNNNQLKQNNLVRKNMNKNSNKSININININKPRHSKNKTYDFNTINQSEPLSKFNTNNNFDNFKAILSNNRNTQKRKINSKFNLIKKPIYEVIRNPILSSHIKKSYNKITINRSISKNKEKKKKCFYGLNNNSNNLYQNKKDFDSPNGHYSHQKKNSLTFSSEENRLEKMKLERIMRKNKKQNKSNNKKNIIKNNNKCDSIKGNNNNWKIQTSNISPLTNYSSNLNKISKNINYSSCNNTLKIDNSTSNNNNQAEALRSTKKANINDINININTINNIIKNKNKSNNKLFDEININQNENLFISRNKKQKTSKISCSQSQNEVNINDIHIKTLKNLKANCISSKSHKKNMTCSNDSSSNCFIPKYNLNYNFGNINTSTEIKNNHIKDILFKLNKISIKRKNKKNSQKLSKKKDKIKFYIKPKIKFKDRGILSGDNIFKKKKVAEMKQNSLKINNRSINKDNYNLKSNNTISHRERNSLRIINVNRNINLIKNNIPKNMQKLTKV